MKKIMMAMMCIAILAGCSNDKDMANNNDKNNIVDDSKNAMNDVKDTTKSWYGNFEDALKDKKMTYSSKTSLDASSIGGAEGYRYVTENGNIDIYRYEDGDDFNKIMKDKKINLNGKDYNVEVNDHYVMVSDGVSDDILNVFRGLSFME